MNEVFGAGLNDEFDRLRIKQILQLLMIDLAVDLLSRRCLHVTATDSQRDSVFSEG